MWIWMHQHSYGQSICVEILFLSCIASLLGLDYLIEGAWIFPHYNWNLFASVRAQNANSIQIFGTNHKQKLSRELRSGYQCDRGTVLHLRYPIGWYPWRDTLLLVAGNLLVVGISMVISKSTLHKCFQSWACTQKIPRLCILEAWLWHKRELAVQSILLQLVWQFWTRCDNSILKLQTNYGWRYWHWIFNIRFVFPADILWYNGTPFSISKFT